MFAGSTAVSAAAAAAMSIVELRQVALVIAECMSPLQPPVQSQLQSPITIEVVTPDEFTITIPRACVCIHVIYLYNYTHTYIYINILYILCIYIYIYLCLAVDTLAQAMSAFTDVLWLAFVEVGWWLLMLVWYIRLALLLLRTSVAFGIILLKGLVLVLVPAVRARLVL